jgi:uncharacterized protein
LIVVSDASPILNLSAIERLDVLRKLYGTVFVPTAVEEELGRNGVELDVDWIAIRSPRDVDAVERLRSLLDLGESEAIVLAEECAADLLLIDERRGWKIASARSLTCVGLLGLLAEAKRRRLIEGCQPILDEMIRKAGFWIGEHLRTRFLEGVGEL